MTLEELARSRYVSLTTYRKDGTPVATPVWFVVDGGEVYIWTKSDTWKVKRIRNNGRVSVIGCDVRGRSPQGATALEGEARLLDDATLNRVRKLLAKKYTWQYWAVDLPALLARGGKRPHTGIAVRV
ncbi:PPOX class F420-dependent oxidoreductase [Streptomyces sp. NPDC098789]|uniref:PPOX class F420-dependent oxidoreductase n=1 Tax=Streptomyces sp. NPDC098789 TaxID=3366098 RepID=UPI0037F4C509